MTKVLGISFGTKNGNNDSICKEALMGAAERGCEVEFIRAMDLDIKHCTGCITCVKMLMSGRGNMCIHKDDFDWLFFKMAEADGIVICDPIFETGASGLFHTIMDRFGPRMDTGNNVISTQIAQKIIAEGGKAKLPDPRIICPGKPISYIGIGGSDLGPVMVYEALKSYVAEGLSARFISNIDPTDCAEKVADLDPETTLFIIASKTFTTLETLTNARMARDWFLAALQAKGIETDGAIAKHFVAVSTALDKVEAFGIDPANAFGFWSWVGGRYSVDSAVGTVLAVTIGPENFQQFLSGFHAVDEHFATRAPAQNVPMLMGLLNVWYTNFYGAASHAVLPYAQDLHRFPAYLQQLTMESNGKSVRWDGTPVTTDTGEIFWGEPGTNGQHAFYQLIHQGTRLIPADFIAVADPAHPTEDGGVDVHELFLSNYLAQTAALAFGKTADEVRAEGTAEEIVHSPVRRG